jgi:phage shock protein PspC (stress-responsive transcriptional regulator)
LTKSQDKRFFGVCGGIADYLGWRASGVRGAWFIASLLTGGTGLLIYLLLAIVMPPAPATRKFDLNDFRVQ